MKKRVTIVFLFIAIHLTECAFSQDIPVYTEQQLENQTDMEQGETEDDSYVQELEQFRKNPLNLNTAAADELKQLRLITGLQIANLLAYRNLFGNLISIYELQAVPSWDLATIRKLLPFITVTLPFSAKEIAGVRFREGDHILLLRLAQVLESSEGYKPTGTGTKYLGSPQRIFLRYRYTYKNLLQFGLAADKDAGEQFFKGVQKKGFDFYSFHFFASKLGMVQSLALGDFTVNMGQGLIQWQGLAFKKSAEVLGVKRQSAVLRPYNSAGEYYFHRGAGITIKKGKLETTAFVSLRKLDANFVRDTLDQEDFISSFLSSGYHRTDSENGDRNKLMQTTFGAAVIYKSKRWHAGWNGIYYHFSLPVKKRNEPYNLYAISGKSWNNFSIDYSYTCKNFHFFGEAAADKQLHTAFVNGILLSVDPRVDISVVQRSISKAYQSVNGNAFTENALPTNETGFYAGIVIRPFFGWRIDMYGDLYKFPWLKYGVDASSYGKDYMVQVSYTPNKQVELYSRYRNETKETNQPENTTVTNFLVAVPKKSWRTQVNYKLSQSFTLRNRVELVLYNKKGPTGESGFLSFFDILYKPMLKPFSFVLRLQYFESDGYDSRIYAYENDVLYSYSIPVFFDKGFRFCLTVTADLSKKLSVWVRWAQTAYRDKAIIGSGTDAIRSSSKNELKLQGRYIF